MNEELEEVVLENVDHLIKPFLVGVLGQKVDGKDEIEYIRTFTPTADQLKKNPGLTEGKYILIEFTAKPSVGQKFASRTRRAAVKTEIINEGTPEYGYYAEQIAQKRGELLEYTKDTDQPVFVLKDEIEYILKRYKCAPSLIQQKDGKFMQSSYTVVKHGVKDTEMRPTVVTGFSMLFLPSDYQDVTLRNELIAREKERVELFPDTGEKVVISGPGQNAGAEAPPAKPVAPAPPTPPVTTPPVTPAPAPAG